MVETIRDYLELCKPRVVALMLLTSIAAMILASPSGYVSLNLLMAAALGIGFAACSGGVINQLIDRHVDEIMGRTKNRPLPAGRVKPKNAAVLAAVLAISGMFILFTWVNSLTALLSFLALIGYAVVYSLFLKRATSQNIVIGGLAGAMPPLLGWSAVTHQINAPALLLVLIIFIWTPPHFWALAIYRHKEYASANIPMLPVTHGITYTRLSILLYTILLVAVTYLPCAIGMTGLVYLLGATVLNVIFLYYVIRLYRAQDLSYSWETFRYSIVYLMLLFLLLLIDHYLLWI